MTEHALIKYDEMCRAIDAAYEGAPIVRSKDTSAQTLSEQLISQVEPSKRV